MDLEARINYVFVHDTMSANMSAYLLAQIFDANPKLPKLKNMHSWFRPRSDSISWG